MTPTETEPDWTIGGLDQVVRRAREIAADKQHWTEEERDLAEMYGRGMARAIFVLTGQAV